MIKHVDVVHIQWFSIPKFDAFLLMLFKGRVRIVHTAHNVLPHVGGDRYLEEYRKIYTLCDSIIVHGRAIEAEFKQYFPDLSHKVRIEHHGLYFGLSGVMSNANISSDIVKKIELSKKTVIFFGSMHYDKGVDLLLRVWLKEYSERNEILLIVVGKKSSSYHELTLIEEEIYQCKNIVYKPEEIDEQELNYYLFKSDIIAMPYRAASMSGVVFKAAEVSRTIITTDVGSISEYLNYEDCFIVENQNTFRKKLKKIINDIGRNDLYKMGERLHSYIIANYSWETIVERIISDVYL